MAAIVANTGSNNWNTNGAWVGGVQPTAADDVTLPATAVVSLPASTTCVCRSLTIAASGQITYLATTSILNIGDATAGTGNVALSVSSTATIQQTATGQMNFISTSATQQTITTGGKTLPTVSINGAGSSYIQGDAFTSTTGFGLTAGTFNTGNFNLTILSINTGGAVARTLTLGSSSVTLTGTNTSASMSGTNFTLNAGTSTVDFRNTLNAPTWLGTWNNMTVTQAGAVFVGSGLTCANFTRTGTAVTTDGLAVSAAFTVTTLLTITGNSTSNRITAFSSTVNVQRTITAASVSLTNVCWMDIAGAGAATWSGTVMGDEGGNSNIAFDTAAPYYWIGGTGSWSSASHWSLSSGGSATTRPPLPQDDVNIDANSFTGNTQTITVDMPHMGKNISSAGSTGTSNTLLFSNTITTLFFGSVSLASGTMIPNQVNGSGIIIAAGRGNFTITSNGVGWFCLWTIQAPGGTYTLQDALTTLPAGGRQFTFNFGTFDANGFSMYHSIYVLNPGITQLNLGSGIWDVARVAVGGSWQYTAAASKLNAGTSTIRYPLVVTGLQTFSGNGAAYNILTMATAGSTGGLAITGANYFDTINFSDSSNARTLTLPSSILTTVRNLNVVGTSGKLMSIISSSGGTPTQLALYGVPPVVDYLSLQDIYSVIPYKFYAGANSTSVSGNTNVTISAIVTGPYILKDIVQETTGTSSTATFAASQTATAGNMLFASITFGAINSVPTTPSGWTANPDNPTSASASASVYSYYKVAAGGETGVTIAYTNANTSDIWVAELAGFTGTPTFDVHDHNADAGSTVSALVTGSGVTNTGTPAIGLATWALSNSPGLFVSLTNSWQSDRHATGIVNVRAALLMTSTGSQSTTYTWTTARRSAVQMVIFKDVTSGVTARGSTLMLMGVG